MMLTVSNQRGMTKRAALPTKDPTKKNDRLKREKGNDVFPNLLKLNKILGFVFSLSFFIPTTTTISGNQSPSLWIVQLMNER